MATISRRFSRLRWKLAASATAATVTSMLAIVILLELATAAAQRKSLLAPRTTEGLLQETTRLVTSLQSFPDRPGLREEALVLYFHAQPKRQGGMRFYGPDLPSAGVPLRWIALVDAQGKAQRVIPETVDPAIPQDAWQEIPDRSGSGEARTLRAPDGNTRIVAGLGPAAASSILVLEAATGEPGYRKLGRRLLLGLPGTLLTLLPLGALVGLGLGLGISRGLVRRLQRLGTTAAAWSRGDLEARVGDPSSDELGELGRNLEAMARRLEALMAARQTSAATEERNHLARELHDTVKQQTFSASLFLASADSLLEENPSSARDNLREAREILEGSRRDLEGLIQALGPSALTRQSLSAALEELAGEWTRRHGIRCRTRIPREGSVSPEVEQAFLRVAQEALANAARHARARQVTLKLDFGGEEGAGARLILEDDGQGFEVEAARKRGFGLQSMEGRMNAVGGSLEIESRLGSGTRILATAPRGPGEP